MFQEMYLLLLPVNTNVLIISCEPYFCCKTRIIKKCKLLTLGDDVILLRLHMYQFVLDLIELANREASLLYRLLRVSSLSFNLTR